MKYARIYLLFLTFAFSTFCKGQDSTRSWGPKTITRNIIQDKKGNIWIAAFDGVFRYDGESCTNITNKVSAARFFSVLEDKKGNLWFGSIGAGVFRYDGQSFTNFTTKEGLLNNDVGSIYEDKKGNIWFGVFGGASCYNGQSFRNYIIDGNTMSEDATGKTFSERPPYEVTSITEDKTGKLWLGTRGNTFVYDGKAFTVFAHDGEPFKNVRSIIADKKGNVWLGGHDGLWRYDGHKCTGVSPNFVGYIYEDRKGDIWTSSESNMDSVWTGSQPGNNRSWELSCYDGKSSAVNRIKSAYEGGKGMIFGILEAKDGQIWFGALDGVYRYDGRTAKKL